MKHRLIKLTSILLLVLFPLTIFSADCDKSNLKGRVEAARSHNSIGWGVAGVGSGFLLGLIGTAAITGIAYLPNPNPKELPTDVNLDIQCFNEGYSKKAKSKNLLSALGGGAIGTLIAVIVLSNMQK